jgi:hypothetical protein
VARATNSILSPCGHAWFYAYKQKPNLEYIEPNWNDAMHPGSFTAYLNTCCFYAVLTGKSPVGHTWHKVWFGDTITLPDSTALFAQQKAWEAYQYFNGGVGVQNSAQARSTHATFSGIRCEVFADRITVTGENILETRLTRLDGTRVAVTSKVANGKASMALPGVMAPGAYLVQSRSNLGWQSQRITLGHQQ